MDSRSRACSAPENQITDRKESRLYNGKIELVVWTGMGTARGIDGDTLSRVSIRITTDRIKVYAYVSGQGAVCKDAVLCD